MWYKVNKIYVGTQQVRPATIPLNWLLAYRPFENNANDISWNWYNGTVTWCSFWEISWKKGVRLATSLSEPSTNYITTQLNNHTIPQTVTIRVYQLWVWNDWTYVMDNADTDNGESFRLRFNSSHNLQSWWYWIAFTGWSYKNTWTMITAVITSWTLKLYINWVLSNTFTWTNMTSHASRFVFGTWYSRQWSFNQRCFPWWIRHAAVYSRALTDSEVLQFYNNTK